MTATWVALIARSRIISNQQYIPCSLYQTCLVRDSGRLKIVPRNISQMAKVETTYLGRMHITQPPEFLSKCSNRVIGPCHQRDQIKFGPVKVEIKRLNDKKQQDVETTHLGCAHNVQPHRNNPKHRYGVPRPSRRRGRIKIEPINVSPMRNGGKAYLGHVIAIWSTWRSKRKIRRLNKLTLESRMQGERRRDVEDHG